MNPYPLMSTTRTKTTRPRAKSAKAATRTQKLSRTANQAARAIVQQVETETGKELSLQTSLNIVGVIQACMDEAVSEARAKDAKPPRILVSNERLYSVNHEALERLARETARDEIFQQQRVGGTLFPGVGRVTRGIL